MIRRVLVLACAMAHSVAAAQDSDGLVEASKAAEVAKLCVRTYAGERATVTATATEIADAALAFCAQELVALEREALAATGPDGASGLRREILDRLRREAILVVIETRNKEGRHLAR